MTDTEAKNHGYKPQQTPGALLKQARERLGLGQKEIAAQLNLQPDIIDALENDDKEKMPAPAYARGYIRGYARIVKIDADMLVRLYNEGSIPPPEIIPNIKKPAQASSRDKPVRAITYLITFTLALLLVAWLQSKYIVEKKPADAIPITGTDEHLYPIKPNTAPEPPVTVGSEHKQERPAPAAETLSLPPGSAETTESILNDTEATDVPAIDTTPSADVHPGPAQITEELTASTDKVQFLVSRDSWIEVHDANKALLYHGLVKAGDELKLSGKAPFVVVLGFAPGVQVRFNGTPFNTEPYTNAGIARFTLGSAD